MSASTSSSLIAQAAARRRARGRRGRASDGVRRPARGRHSAPSPPPVHGAALVKNVAVAPDAVYPMAATLSLAIHILELVERYTDAEALHAQLEAMVVAAGDRSAMAMCILLMVKSIRDAQGSDPVGMLEHAKRGCELARQCGHRRMEGIGSLVTAVSVWCLGAPDEAERILQALPLSDTEFGPVSAYRPFVMAWMLAERGALAEARAYADHLALTLGRARGLPLDEGRGRWVFAEVLRRAGALEEAEREVDSALRLLGRTCPTDVSGVLATKAALRLAQAGRARRSPPRRRGSRARLPWGSATASSEAALSSGWCTPRASSRQGATTRPAPPSRGPATVSSRSPRRYPTPPIGRASSRMSRRTAGYSSSPANGSVKEAVDPPHRSP
ncbi:hypothetical protein [Sorangium sp. So ce131]|uniref:hypothetical protein n=1 Tax=Sorangium sp. So ce131 TaxID=3133282 RepID=UPI003F5F28D6